MRPISQKNRRGIDKDEYFRHCARGNSDCMGRVEIEHALYYQGRQLDELWSFVPLCTYHHRGRGLDKRLNQYLALIRATEEDLNKYPRAEFKRLLSHLNEKYGRGNPDSQSLPRPTRNEESIPPSQQ